MQGGSDLQPATTNEQSTQVKTKHTPHEEVDAKCQLSGENDDDIGKNLFEDNICHNELDNGSFDNDDDEFESLMAYMAYEDIMAYMAYEGIMDCEEKHTDLDEDKKRSVLTCLSRRHDQK